MNSFKPSGFLHDQRTDKSSDTWFTPKYIIDSLGPFDLDVCANNPRPFDCATTNWTIEDDSLSKDWPKDKFIWMNPPYEQRKIDVWMSKLAEHNNGISLTFARTDTKWFQKAASLAQVLLFLNGRLRFLKEDGTQGMSAPACSVLMAFGMLPSYKLEDCNLPGLRMTTI